MPARQRVVYQGTKGCNSEMAAQKFFPGPVEGIGVRNFEDIFELLGNGKAEYGILPIENSLLGSIHYNYDLLLANENTWIVGEIILRISYDLLSFQQNGREKLTEIWSHPVALQQCRKVLLEYADTKVVAFFDSAGAAKVLSEERTEHVAVIASPDAGRLYGLHSLKKMIEDDPRNFTRFLVLSREQRTTADERTKTSIVFGVKNEPGVLFRTLSFFALRNIDLTKLESRPIIGKPWEYIFYLDFHGSILDKNCEAACMAVKTGANYYRFLGSYSTRGME